MVTSISDSADSGKISIRLEPGECATLSPDSSRFGPYYRQARPRSADDVKQILGLDQAQAQALKSRMCCSPLPPVVVPADDVNAKDDAVRFTARSAAYQALQEYVRSPDPAHLSVWNPLMKEFLAATKSLINIVTLADIDVADSATLTISSNTHAIYANSVRIHGSGKIVCQGAVTFKINTLEGITPVETATRIPRVKAASLKTKKT